MDFQGDEIAAVLRLLARQGGVNLFVSDRVQGTITMRMEGKSPVEAIRFICRAKGLVLDTQDRDFFIKTISERAPQEAFKAEAELNAIYLATLYKKMVEEGVPADTAKEIVKTAPLPVKPQYGKKSPDQEEAGGSIPINDTHSTHEASPEHGLMGGGVMAAIVMAAMVGWGLGL